MINLVWLIMITLAAICGLINGRMEEVSTAVLNSSKDGFYLVLNLGGMMIFWMVALCGGAIYIKTCVGNNNLVHKSISLEGPHRHQMSIKSFKNVISPAKKA